MNSNFCEVCQQTFVLKELYEKHTISCNFFYKKHNNDKEKKKKTKSVIKSSLLIGGGSSSCNNENEENEELSPKEMFKMIQLLVLKCDKLEKEIEKIKKQNSKKVQKPVFEFPTYDPNLSLKEWTKTISITPLLLEEVFHNNLSYGIKLFFENEMNKLKKNFPFFSSKEKATSLFVFVEGCNNSSITNSEENVEENVEIIQEKTINKRTSKEKKLFEKIVLKKKKSWILLTNPEFEKIINLISHQFIIQFTLWQEQHHKNVNEDLLVKYMLKIFNNETKEKTEIKKWLIQKLCIEEIHQIENLKKEEQDIIIEIDLTEKKIDLAEEEKMEV